MQTVTLRPIAPAQLPRAKRMIAMTALTAVAAGVWTASPTQAVQAMGVYKWKNRPVLIFAPSAQSQAYQRQRAILLSKRGGLRDRDMVVIAVLGNSVRALLGRGPGISAAALRRRYGVGSSRFQTVLVGKDGGAKLRSSAPISTNRLFRLIDSMPMRRQEMRRRNG